MASANAEGAVFQKSMVSVTTEGAVCKKSMVSVTTEGTVMQKSMALAAKKLGNTQKGCTIPIVFGIFVTAVVTSIFRYSTTVAEFLFELGIENPVWQNVLTGIVGSFLGIASIYILNKIIKDPKPDNSYSLPVPMDKNDKS
jgi:hypothetical protein